MNYQFSHNNINVSNLESSLEFYQKVFGLLEVKRKIARNNSFIIVFLGDSNKSRHLLELTYLKDRKEKYDLGDNEFHLAFEVDDYESSLAKHKEMGIVCFENTEMNIYFVEDPDGYWIEVLPTEKY